MAAPNQLSFLPDDYLERKTQRRTNLICAVLFVLVMGTIAAAFAISESASKKLQHQRAQIDEQYNEAAKRIDQVRVMQEKQSRMAHQAELTASLLERVPRSYLLADITNALPAGVSLLDFSLDSHLRVAPAASTEGKTAYDIKKAELEARADPVAPTDAPKIYDVNMKITGLATNDVLVAQFLKRLGKSRLFSDVNLVISDEFLQGTTKMRKFQIEMILAPDAEVKPTTMHTATAQ